MALYQAEEKERLRREKVKEAITLATQSRWKEAELVNRLIIQAFPQGAEAYNRLGKALSELGHYSEARANFRRALELSPYNTIAKKNLARLASLEDETPKQTKVKESSHRYFNFVAERGKATTTSLLDIPSKKALARLAAGEVVQLSIEGRHLQVRDADDRYLGKLEPKLALRLIRLIKGGNRYEASVASVGESCLTVLIRETFKHPSQTGIVSFPCPVRDFSRPQQDAEIPKYGLNLVEEEEAIEGYDLDDSEKESPGRWLDNDGDGDDEDEGEPDMVEASGFHEEIHHVISLGDLDDDQPQ